MGPPRIRIAIDVKVVTNPLDFAAHFAIWFIFGLSILFALGLVK